MKAHLHAQTSGKSDITHRSAGPNKKAVNTEAADVFVCFYELISKVSLLF